MQMLNPATGFGKPPARALAPLLLPYRKPALVVVAWPSHRRGIWFGVAGVPWSATESDMESRTKLLGHPIHPILVVYPLALLSTAVVFDIGYIVTNNQDLATFSYWALAAGIVGGLAAAVFGFVDWLGIPSGTRARRVGMLHGAGNVVVVLAFALSFFARINEPAYLPNLAPLLFGVIGAMIALVTAWLGGELVYRLRVGVDDGAHLDASSSLASDRDSGAAAT